MENKVLVKLIVPEINTSFDIFIPVNEAIWRIKGMIAKSICNITNINFPMQDKMALINKQTSQIYKSNEIVIDTDIKNYTELILISQGTLV